MFLHHLSRDGDPQLHVHVAIWNRVQRANGANGADGKWRTLDSRSLHNQRLTVAPVADRILETKLTALGYVMVPRADGNGAEIGGVAQGGKDLFSSRAVAVIGELDRLAREYQAVHGKPALLVEFQHPLAEGHIERAQHRGSPVTQEPARDR